MGFEYYPDTHSLYIELNPGRKRKPGGTQEAIGWGSRDIVIGVDSYGVPVGIDIGSFASEIVDLSKLEAEGPIFGVARVGAGETGWLASIGETDRGTSGHWRSTRGWRG